MNWKVVFLVVLLLFASVVTIGVTALSVKIPTTFGPNFCQANLNEIVPLQPIDDGPGA